MDVARVGGFDLPRLLVISSACHGVEGHCGSGVQHALLSNPGFLHGSTGRWRGAALRARAEPARLLAQPARHARGRGPEPQLHCVRGSGRPAPPCQPWLRRVGATCWCPPRGPPSGENEAALQAYEQQHGQRGFQQAVSGGQYLHPAGLFLRRQRAHLEPPEHRARAAPARPLACSGWPGSTCTPAWAPAAMASASSRRPPTPRPWPAPAPGGRPTAAW